MYTKLAELLANGNAREALQYTKSINDVELWCVMLPELCEPSEFGLLKDIVDNGLDPQTMGTSQRDREVQQYVQRELEKVGWGGQCTWDSVLMARVRYVAKLSANLMLYKKLCGELSWFKHVVKPLDHYNTRTESGVTLEEWEALGSSAVKKIWLQVTPSAVKLVLQYELVPLCDYYGHHVLWDLVDHAKFGLSRSTLGTLSLLVDFGLPTSKAVDILFRNNEELHDGESDHAGIVAEVVKLLGKLDCDTTKLQALNNVSLLLDTFDLVELSRELSHDEQFSTIVSILNRNLTASSDIKSLAPQILEITKHLYTKVPQQKVSSMIFDHLLSIGCFEPELSSGMSDKELEEMVIDHFYRFFRAGDLANAEKVLKVINYSGRLTTLLRVSRDISQYSRLQPLDLFKYEPLEVVQKLLETGIYTKYDMLLQILNNLCIGLAITPVHGSENKLHAMTIECALANNDFEFAFAQSMELIKTDCAEQWLTLFQVGKFINPNWPDGEAPTEVLHWQMELLGKLLDICPVSEVQVILTQWTALELELSIR